MKVTFFVVLTLLVSSFLSADTINLKDGKVFTGTLVSQNDFAVEFQTMGTTIYFKQVDVASLKIDKKDEDKKVDKKPSK